MRIFYLYIFESPIMPCPYSSSTHSYMLFITDSIYFQTGEFFYSAQRSAAEQQREMVADQSGDSSLESPLLHQVRTILLVKQYISSPCFHTSVELFAMINIQQPNSIITTMLQRSGARILDSRR